MRNVECGPLSVPALPIKKGSRFAGRVMAHPPAVNAAVLLFPLLFLSACGKKTPGTLFSKLEPAETGIAFSNTLPEETPDGMNIIQYLYYYNGGGVAAGDVNNDGLADLYFTANLGPNKLYLNKGNFTFEDATDRAGVAGTGDWKTGVTMADVNGDGRLDIYVSQVGRYKQFSGKNQLFINQGDGTFIENAAAYGLDFSVFGTQAAFFDYDLDQDLDCFVLCHSVHSPGSYRDTAYTRKYDPLAADRLLENPATGGQKPATPAPFRDVSAQKGLYGGAAGYGLGLAVGDLNADGYPDMYVANDFHENDYLYYNAGGRVFREDVARSMGHTSNFSMGCDLADFNNDTRPDLVSLDMKPEEEHILKAGQAADPYDVYLYKYRLGYHWQFPRNALQLNTGGGRRTADGGPSVFFSEIGQLAGIAATDWSWSALFADLDLDGWKDLYVTNGIIRRPNDLDYLRFISTEEAQRKATDRQLIEKMPSGDAGNYCFRNRGDLGFDNTSRQWGLNQRGCSNGAVYVDLDNDGDLDLVTNNLNEPVSIYRNNTRDANYLKIKFQGEGLNSFGIGASVTLWAGGQVQYYENQPVRGFQSSVEPNLTIGLGANNRADSLLVCWPGGKKQVLRAVGCRQTLTLRASEAGFFSKSEKTSVAIPPVIRLDRHTSGDFQDNAREKLIPWFVSTQGPKLAVGDLNGDGLDDIYVPGGSDGVHLQQKNGDFTRTTALPGAPPAAAQTCATFFDADADGNPDLYLGTGYSSLGGDSTLLDVLLFNPGGAGRFTRAAETALPPLREHGSCARAADADGDGDLDLFVGGRSIGGAYGLIPNSYLLFNDGKGHFSQAPAAWWPETKIGMVNDALWADLNGDGRPDLAVAGAWMPLTLFTNTGAGFEKTEIPNSAGLWNSLAAADVDGDGDADLVAGNFGLNSNLRATPAEPLGLWVRDFDDNGATDPVMSYYRQGKNRVFADKDWLLGQLPGLKKDYVDYRKYAESSFEQVFTKKMRENAAFHRVEVLETALFINNGKDGWRLKPLPPEAQFTPVFALLPGDFNSDGHLDLLLGGNLYEVQPAIGRMDASYGTLLAGDGKGGFKAVPPGASGFWLDGAVRDLQFVRSARGKKRIVVGRNDGEIVIVPGMM